MPISPSISPRSTSPVDSSSSHSLFTNSLHSLDLEEKTLFRDPFNSQEHIHPYTYQTQHTRSRIWTPAYTHEQNRSTGALSSSARRRVRRWIAPVSLGVNVVLFGLVLFMLANPCAFSGRSCVYARGGESGDGLKLLSEVKGVVPEFNLEKVTFMNDSRYANERMFTDKAEHQKILNQWEADVPVGRGFVSIPDDKISHLPRPFHINSNPALNGYSIASFHQYHCLWMIMAGYGRAVFPPELQSSQAHKMSHAMVHDEAEATRHITHCFDYLRQSVLCAGDSALEGKSEAVNGMTDGWGNEHVCRSVTAQKKWIVENRLSDNIGIH